jgi:hypothetical protein
VSSWPWSESSSSPCRGGVYARVTWICRMVKGVVKGNERNR